MLVIALITAEIVISNSKTIAGMARSYLAGIMVWSFCLSALLGR